MILIADSGSTKTDWAIVEQGKETVLVSTKGMNPYFQTEEDIKTEIELHLLPFLANRKPVESIYFYGAGCTDEKKPMMQSALKHQLQPTGRIVVYSDMVGVAHALCKNQPGIACILGTGSNSCFYDGERIVENVSPLGFILGDEGSGAVLGKLIVGDLLKNQLGAELKEAFFEYTQLTPAMIIEQVYRKPFPNRFLASLSPFIHHYIAHPWVYQLVKNSFCAFFKRNVMQYNYQHYPIHFVGSIAYHYQEVLQDAANEMGITIETIEKSPISGLISYYQNK